MPTRHLPSAFARRIAAGALASLLAFSTLGGLAVAGAQDGTAPPPDTTVPPAVADALAAEAARQAQILHDQELERQRQAAEAEQARQAAAAEQERLAAIAQYEHQAAVAEQQRQAAEVEFAQRADEAELERAEAEEQERLAAIAEFERQAAIAEQERAEALERARREAAARRARQLEIKKLRMQQYADTQQAAAEERRASEPWSALADMPQSAQCDTIEGDDIPQLVADIFRCHLRAAGFSEAEVWWVAAEAVVVAGCESGFEPEIVVFNGAYKKRAHPLTGSRYTAAGVFQFIRRTANDWIVGGYGNVFDATANIDAAARLYLHNRAQGLDGWEDWACDAVNDGFAKASVLPTWSGGPDELPEWAFRY
jgi:murein DD-endopeptidase MepM/ murein hydrolase activator NlpD